MKTILLFLLICLGVESSFASIVLRAQASPVESDDTPYFLPQNPIINPDATNLFITMDGVDKICFLNKTPSLLFEQLSMVIIIINGVKTEWNCFPYKTTTMVVRP